MSEQGIVSCEVTLEISGYVYPGSGLQTGTGGSEFGSHKLGNFFYRDRRQMESIFIVFHHGTMKVNKKSISKKLIIPEKSIITLKIHFYRFYTLN